MNITIESINQHLFIKNNFFDELFIEREKHLNQNHIFEEKTECFIFSSIYFVKKNDTSYKNSFGKQFKFYFYIEEKTDLESNYTISSLFKSTSLDLLISHFIKQNHIDKKNTDLIRNTLKFNFIMNNANDNIENKKIIPKKSKI